MYLCLRSVFFHVSIRCLDLSAAMPACPCLVQIPCMFWPLPGPPQSLPATGSPSRIPVPTASLYNDHALTLTLPAPNPLPEPSFLKECFDAPMHPASTAPKSLTHSHDRQQSAWGSMPLHFRDVSGLSTLPKPPKRTHWHEGIKQHPGSPQRPQPHEGITQHHRSTAPLQGPTRVVGPNSTIAPLRAPPT